MEFISSYEQQCVKTKQGKAQMEGEFRAMTELRKTIPGMVPRPISWGELRDGSAFFMCEYLDISDKLPDPAKLGVLLAELHNPVPHLLENLASTYLPMTVNCPK